jgi:hypothetical protein
MAQIAEVEFLHPTAKWSEPLTRLLQEFSETCERALTQLI